MQKILILFVLNFLMIKLCATENDHTNNPSKRGRLTESLENYSSSLLEKLPKMVKKHVISSHLAAKEIAALQQTNRINKLTFDYDYIAEYKADENISDTRLQEMARSCSNLRRIKLNGCRAISDLGLFALARYYMKLESFEFSHCYTATPELGLLAVGKYYQLLQRVDFSCCHELPETVVIALAPVYDQSAKLVSGCPDLQVLNLKACFKVTNLSLTALAACKKLHSINLSSNKIADLSALAAYPSLHAIKLCGQSTTNAEVISLATNCPRLKAIDLFGCINVTDAVITTIVEYCLELQEINISYCTKVTETGLIAIAKCKKLCKVELDWCHYLTNFGIELSARFNNHSIYPPENYYLSLLAGF